MKTLSHLILTLIAMSLFFTGCAYTPRTITAPDGSPANYTQCPSMEYCYKWAQEHCQGPYDVLDKTTRQGSVTNGEGGGTSIDFTFRCKK